MYTIILTMSVILAGVNPMQVSGIDVKLKFEDNKTCVEYYQQNVDNMPQGMALKKGAKICAKE